MVETLYSGLEIVYFSIAKPRPMKRFMLPLIILLSFLSGGPSTARQSPNIIFIIGDDISWDDIGAYGNKKVKTPHLDKMARDGMLFRNVFLTASSCSPSRTSILTGRYPHNTGAAELHTPLPEHLSYFPESLRQKGYFTALAGKWHEGAFTKRAYDTLLVDRQLNGDGGEDQWLNLLNSRPAGKPFFFWLAPFDAHRPWASGTPSVHNPDSEVEVPLNLADSEETRKDLARYYDEISRLDQHIGALIGELERQKIADNTLIVFTSDNGRAFPGSKTRLYDAGLKAPFIVRWPAGVSPGQSCGSLVSSIDIAPTLLELAGAVIPASVQGKSFAGLFADPAQAFRKFVFAEHNWHDYAAYERSVRTVSFLYIVNKRTGLDNGGPIDANQSPSAASLKAGRSRGALTPLQNDVFLRPRPAEELFDNDEDPAQSVNLAGEPKYSGPLSELRAILRQWQLETGDTVPEQLTPDWYDRETGRPLPAKGQRGEMPGAARKADRVNEKGPF